jgi:hypothetical protein
VGIILGYPVSVQGMLPAMMMLSISIDQGQPLGVDHYLGVARDNFEGAVSLEWLRHAELRVWRHVVCFLAKHHTFGI